MMDPKMKAATERRNKALTEMNAAADALDELIGSDEGSDEERGKQQAAAQDKFDMASATFTRAEFDVGQLEAIAKSRANVARPIPADEDDKSTATRADIKVGKEALIYRPDVREGFFRDLTRASTDRTAFDRLARNNEEYVTWAKTNLTATQLNAAGINQTATSGGEFVPPVWYVDQYAPLLRAGRPYLNALGTSDLPPDTNSLNFPKITTGSSVAVQTDAGAVSNTDLVTTSVTAQVQTEAGRSIASYQFVDLGPISDQVILEDLTFAYNTALDTSALTGAVTNAKGLLNITSPNTVTYTDASPTGAEFYLPTAQSASQIAKNAFVGTDFGVTHPSIWYNILAGLDTQTRPLYLTVGPGVNVAGDGSLTSTPANGIVGNIGGIPVCVDANIPTNLGGGTNESRLVFLNRRGVDFWESAPRFKVADQTSIANLQYQFVMYGYYATTSRQSKMVSIVSGTGLIPVSGF